MQVTFINLNNIKLDFSNNYFQNITFNYKNNNYTFNIYLKDSSIFIYQENFVIAKISINQIIKTAKFDLIFCQENFQNDNDLNIESIFSKYKLGVLNYV